jgi:hypothetical protein
MDRLNMDGVNVSPLAQYIGSAMEIKISMTVQVRVLP